MTNTKPVEWNSSPFWRLGLRFSRTADDYIWNRQWIRSSFPLLRYGRRYRSRLTFLHKPILLFPKVDWERQACWLLLMSARFVRSLWLRGWWDDFMTYVVRPKSIVKVNLFHIIFTPNQPLFVFARFFAHVWYNDSGGAVGVKWISWCSGCCSMSLAKVLLGKSSRSTGIIMLLYDDDCRWWGRVIREWAVAIEST